MNAPASDRPQLLVTLLDWGMGHATRTLPLIEHAAACGWHVHVATKGTALAWLKRHLDPALPLTFHDKPGPEIKYAKRGNFLRIAGQMPAFVAHVERERTWTSNFVEAHGIDAIYSDNCYGTAVPGVPSILMSHQLQVPTPKILEGAARGMVARWAKAFDQLWVPDTAPGPQSLSGHLAAADVHPHTEYVGVLSRLAQHRQDNPPRDLAQSRHGQRPGAPPRADGSGPARLDGRLGRALPCHRRQARRRRAGGRPHHDLVRPERRGVGLGAPGSQRPWSAGAGTARSSTWRPWAPARSSCRRRASPSRKPWGSCGRRGLASRA